MIHLYNKDCMEAMASMEDNEFDLAIVDPPYGIGNFVMQSHETSQKPVQWNDKAPPKKYFYELERVSKHRIIWGANYYTNLIGGRIVWYKHQRHPNMSKCEIAFCSLHSKVEYIDLIWQNVNRKEPIIHPCQKPIKLYTWLLDKYAQQGWKILDTHLGSGSSAIAAHDMGYEFHGYELDTEYFEAASKRLKEHQKQLQLF
jgi:site-specific DNA-methyltransferase (adenine-specific)